MYLAIDLILAVILLATVIGAWRRGLIRTVFKLCTTVAAVVLAVCFHKQLGSYFYDAFLYDALAPHIEGLFDQVVTAIGDSLDFAALAAKLPEKVISLAELCNIDLAAFLEDAVKSMDVGGETFTELGERLAVFIATSAANTLAFSAIFFGGLILLRLVGVLLDKIADLPVLRGANRFLGFLFGILEAAILGIVLSKFAATVCSLYASTSPDFAFGDVANGTYIARFFLSISPW